MRTQDFVKFKHDDLPLGRLLKPHPDDKPVMKLISFEN